MQHLHIAPHALRVAAIFAVLSRLEEPKMAGLTLLKKLKLYDGEDVEGFRQKDVKLIQEQTEREGMDGISPRFIINRISTSLIKPETRCINPIDVLRAIKDGIEQPGSVQKSRPRALSTTSLPMRGGNTMRSPATMCRKRFLCPSSRKRRPCSTTIWTMSRPISIRPNSPTRSPAKKCHRMKSSCARIEEKVQCA